MKPLKFQVVLDGMEGSTVAALSAPFDIQEVFGTRGRVPARGTINGFPFRSSLMPMGGCHRMVVNKAMRDGAGCEDRRQSPNRYGAGHGRSRGDHASTADSANIAAQESAGTLGEAFLYPQRGNRALGHRSKKGRDPGRATEKSGRAIEDWRQVD